MKAIGAALFVIAAVAIAGGRPSAAAEPCNPAGNLGFVCGPLNSEDLVSVPGTAWIVASGMDGGAAGSHGGLHWWIAETSRGKHCFREKSPRCGGTRQPTGTAPARLISRSFRRTASIYDRETTAPTRSTWSIMAAASSIEIFALDRKGAEPSVVWVGCAVMPAHTWPNSVAPLPDGGIVVTDMFDPQDPKASEKMNAGEDTGAVYEWHPHNGFTLVPDSKMSGGNGIEVSRDGKWIYVAAWGNKAVVRLPRGSRQPRNGRCCR